MHIVHIKQQYNSLSEALKDKSGVAVLGFFYQVSSVNSNFYDDGWLLNYTYDKTL